MYSTFVQVEPNKRKRNGFKIKPKDSLFNSQTSIVKWEDAEGETPEFIAKN